MPDKLSRKDAGERVHAAVNALSADLLHDEDGAKEHIDALFVAQAQTVTDLVQAQHGAGRNGADAVAASLTGLARQALSEASTIFGRLSSSTAAKALQSIEQELLACEQTLGARYRGLAVDACRATDALIDAALETAVERFEASAATVLPWFTRQAGTELLQGGKEDYALALDRILSPTPVRAPGHSGKGLWWKIPEHAHRVTREQEFGTVNWIRTAAMHQFNVIGETR